MPDLTFVLDLDVATARARMLRRVRPVGEVDRMEQEPIEFYERVCAAYRELAKRENRRVRLIDGAQSADEIEAEIWHSCVQNRSLDLAMAFSPDAAFKYLHRAHEQGRLAHAYLISGAAGAGKRALASRLANLVNERRRDVFADGRRCFCRRAGFEIAPDRDRADPQSRTRPANARDERTPQSRDRCPMPIGCNRRRRTRFLKTLEEPPNDSLLLLLSAMPEALPDTILSRCIPLPLAAPEDVAPSAEEAGTDRLAQAKSAPRKTAACRRPIGSRKVFTVCSAKCAKRSSTKMPRRLKAGGGALQKYDRRRLAR